MKILGEGKDGRVYSTFLSDGTPVAIKQRQARHLHRALDEQNVLRSMENVKTVIPAPEIFVESDGTVIEMFPLYSSDLHAFIERPDGSVVPLPEDRARHFSRQLAEAVAACHAHNVAHLDIKLENVLIHQESETIVLADFGSARRADKTYDRPTGTRFFAAPECWDVGKGPYFPSNYDVSAADIWSFGQCVLAMTTGRLCSYTHSGSVSWRKTVEQCDLSRDVCELLECTLQFDPSRRISASNLLNLAWFRESANSAESSVTVRVPTVCCSHISITDSTSPHQEGFSPASTTLTVPGTEDPEDDEVVDMDIDTTIEMEDVDVDEHWLAMDVDEKLE